MASQMKKLNAILLGAALLSPVITGCAAHGHIYVQTYGPAEAPYYTQWEHETHRDHVDYEKRKKAEQHDYWEWRKHHHD